MVKKPIDRSVYTPLPPPLFGLWRNGILLMIWSETPGCHGIMLFHFTQVAVAQRNSAVVSRQHGAAASGQGGFELTPCGNDRTPSCPDTGRDPGARSRLQDDRWCFSTKFCINVKSVCSDWVTRMYWIFWKKYPRAGREGVSQIENDSYKLIQIFFCVCWGEDTNSNTFWGCCL